MKSCKDLKENEIVVFNIWSDIYKRKIPCDGNVIFVNHDTNSVAVVYLEGYRCEHANIKFADMLACYDKDGEVMHFDNIYGKSVLLEGGRAYANRMGDEWNNKLKSDRFPLCGDDEYY